MPEKLDFTKNAITIAQGYDGPPIFFWAGGGTVAELDRDGLRLLHGDNVIAIHDRDGRIAIGGRGGTETSSALFVRQLYFAHLRDKGIDTKPIRWYRVAHPDDEKKNHHYFVPVSHDELRRVLGGEVGENVQLKHDGGILYSLVLSPRMTEFCEQLEPLHFPEASTWPSTPPQFIRIQNEEHRQLILNPSRKLGIYLYNQPLGIKWFEETGFIHFEYLEGVGGCWFKHSHRAAACLDEEELLGYVAYDRAHPRLSRSRCLKRYQMLRNERNLFDMGMSKEDITKVLKEL